MIANQAGRPLDFSLPRKLNFVRPLLDRFQNTGSITDILLLYIFFPYTMAEVGEILV